MPEWITTTEAAELTGYSLKQVRNLIHAKKVKGQRWGRDWQVDRRSLLEYARKVQELGAKRGPKPAR